MRIRETPRLRLAPDRNDATILGWDAGRVVLKGSEHEHSSACPRSKVKCFKQFHADLHPHLLMEAATIAANLTADPDLRTKIESALAKLTEGQCELAGDKVEEYRLLFPVPLDGEALLRAVELARNAVLDSMILPPDDPELERVLAALSPAALEMAAKLATESIRASVPQFQTDANFVRAKWMIAATQVGLAMETATTTATNTATTTATTPTRNCMTVVSAADLYDTVIEDVAYLISPLLGRESLGMLSGDSGHLKTHLAHHAAVGVASRGMFLGYQCEAGPVLFLQAEENLRRHRKKLRWIIAGAGLSEVEGRALEIHSVVRPPFLFSDREGRAELVRVVGERKPVLVIIDSLRQSFAGDENDSQFAQIVKETYSEIQAANPCSMLLLHHLRKTSQFASQNDPGQRVRGNTGLKGILDDLWVLNRPDSQATDVIFQHVKGRDGEVPPFTFRVNFDDGRISFENLGADEKVQGAGNSAAVWITEYLAREYHARRGVPVQTGEILKAARAASPLFTKRVTEDALKLNVKLGTIEKVSHGKYRGKPSATTTTAIPIWASGRGDAWEGDNG